MSANMTKAGVLLTILLLSAAIRLAAVMVLDIAPVSDYAIYMRMATSMLATGHMSDGMGNVAFYSAGYPLFLVPFFALFGAGVEVVGFVNAVLGVVSVLLVYLCGREALPNWKWAAAAALLWAVYPPAVLYTEYVAKENLMVPLLLLQTVILLRYSRRPGLFAALTLGLIFGMELMVGPATILTGVLIGVVVIGFNLRKPSLSGLRWAPALGCILGCAIALTPWLAYTYSELGQPVLNTNGSFNLYLGNNANSSAGFVGIQDTPMGAEWYALRREKGQLESMAILQDKALDYMFENPVQTAWRSLSKVAYFWMPPFHTGKFGDQSSLESAVRSVWLVYYLFILTTALLPLLFFRKLERSHLILYATVLLYCAIHAASYVIFRYRLPAMPIMSVLSVYGIWLGYAWWIDRNNRKKVFSD